MARRQRGGTRHVAPDATVEQYAEVKGELRVPESKNPKAPPRVGACGVSAQLHPRATHEPHENKIPDQPTLRTWTLLRITS